MTPDVRHFRKPGADKPQLNPKILSLKPQSLPMGGPSEVSLECRALGLRLLHRSGQFKVPWGFRVLHSRV